jgi:acyl-CoA synthetase (NDP forming)
VISVPKQLVNGVAEECGRVGVKGLVVITAGFREVGGAGVERERELVEIVQRHGMRMVGPNCMGVLNTDPTVSMNATFAPVMPPHGSAAFVSQSGALGLSVLDYAVEYGIGIAQFVSIGNKPNVSGNDLLAAWEHDPRVEIILMYVENFGNPKKFLEIASRITHTKPIVVLKSGRSVVGARAASSHTGALAASDAAVDALLMQAGVLRASSIEELFDMAMGFGRQPLPASRRTAVVTNSGGPGILAADAMEAQGLELVDLDPRTIQQIKPLFPEEASIRNPLDMIASATPSGYREALHALLEDPNVDSVVSIFVPPLGVKQEDVAEAIVSAVGQESKKPVLAVLMGREGLPQGRAELNEAGIPAFIFPESAARALAALVRYRESRERTHTVPPDLAVNKERARAIVERVLAAGRTRLNELESLQLIAAYGIATAPAALVHTAAEAAAAADAIGYPVVMKVVSPNVEHKSDVGGVVTNVRSAVDAALAYRDIETSVTSAQPTAQIEGMLVQAMVRVNVETIAGITRDRVFGPMVMFGLGGVFVEVLRDVQFRLVPISCEDAADMIKGLRGARILSGFRGTPAVDQNALAVTLMRLAQLALDCPEISELDINPLLPFPDGVIAADARVRLEPPAGRA